MSNSSSRGACGALWTVFQIAAGLWALPVAVSVVIIAGAKTCEGVSQVGSDIALRYDMWKLSSDIPVLGPNDRLASMTIKSGASPMQPHL